MSIQTNWFSLNSENLFLCHSAIHHQANSWVAIASSQSFVVFKSPVRSGYWVPNMVTEALTS